MGLKQDVDFPVLIGDSALDRQLPPYVATTMKAHLNLHWTMIALQDRSQFLYLIIPDLDLVELG